MSASFSRAAAVRRASIASGIRRSCARLALIAVRTSRAERTDTRGLTFCAGLVTVASDGLGNRSAGRRSRAVPPNATSTPTTAAAILTVESKARTALASRCAARFAVERLERLVRLGQLHLVEH